MKKHTILWISLITLIILIIGYTLFYMIYKNKETRTEDPEINNEVTVENNETWLFVKSIVSDKNGNEQTNPVNLYGFIFIKDKVDIYYNDEKVLTKNYQLINNELNIIQDENNTIKFTISYEEEFIVLSEQIDGKKIEYYFIKSLD